MNRVRPGARRLRTQDRPTGAGMRRDRRLTFSRGPVGFALGLRQLLVLSAVLVLLVVVSVWAMMQGQYPLEASQVLNTLAGHGDPLAKYFVLDVRAPRVVGAALVGLVLGVSGAVFQILTGNALGSPDIIGFTHGAATGALVQIIVFGAGPLGVALGAVMGGLATAAAVYLLTLRIGLRGLRLVLVGLGIGAMLSVLNSLPVVRAPLGQAQTAQRWLIGSLNAMNWTKSVLLGLCLVALLAAALWAHRPLATLRYGDDVAAGLGVPVARVRVVALFLGVLLVGLATATTGPLSFVALAAPHICRTLTRGRGAGLFGAGLTGALIVLVADQIGQHALPRPVLVGVVTGALGGLYLVYLIARERKNS